MSNAPEIVPLFATPLVTFDVPDAAALNAELRKVIEQREKSHPTTQHSNQGGWQSSHDMDRWGGAAAIKLLAIGRNTANRVTTDREGKPVNSPYPGYFAVTWGANMWANVNRSGHGNEFHSHPGGYWSGVYYVDNGESNPAAEGTGIHLYDANPARTNIFFPDLASPNFQFPPVPGLMILFPSYMPHAVPPHQGDRPRISIAFNMRKEPFP